MKETESVNGKKYRKKNDSNKWNNLLTLVSKMNDRAIHETRASGFTAYALTAALVYFFYQVIPFLDVFFVDDSRKLQAIRAFNLTWGLYILGFTLSRHLSSQSEATLTVKSDIELHAGFSSLKITSAFLYTNFIINTYFLYTHTDFTWLAMAFGHLIYATSGLLTQKNLYRFKERTKYFAATTTSVILFFIAPIFLGCSMQALLQDYEMVSLGINMFIVQALIIMIFGKMTNKDKTVWLETFERDVHLKRIPYKEAVLKLELKYTGLSFDHWISQKSSELDRLSAKNIKFQEQLHKSTLDLAEMNRDHVHEVKARGDEIISNINNHCNRLHMHIIEESQITQYLLAHKKSKDLEELKKYSEKLETLHKETLKILQVASVIKEYLEQFKTQGAKPLNNLMRNLKRLQLAERKSTPFF